MSKKYKVVGNSCPVHWFNIGDIVKIENSFHDSLGFFRRRDGLYQAVALSDVEPIKEPVNRSFIDIIKGWFNNA